MYGMAISLEKPDLAIMVEIMKGACCLSVVEEYFELFKYNIRLCGMTEEERVAEKSRCVLSHTGSHTTAFAL